MTKINPAYHHNTMNQVSVLALLPCIQIPVLNDWLQSQTPLLPLHARTHTHLHTATQTPRTLNQHRQLLSTRAVCPVQNTLDFNVKRLARYFSILSRPQSLARATIHGSTMLSHSPCPAYWPQLDSHHTTRQLYSCRRCLASPTPFLTPQNNHVHFPQYFQFHPTCWSTLCQPIHLLHFQPIPLPAALP